MHVSGKKKRGRPQSQRIRELVRDLERGKLIIVTKSEYKALTPYLKRFREQGRKPVIMRVFMGDTYWITLQELILL